MNSWQNIATLVLVFAATLYVVRRLLRAVGRRRSARCRACCQCDSAADEQPLLIIDPPGKN